MSTPNEAPIEANGQDELNTESSDKNQGVTEVIEGEIHDTPPAESEKITEQTAPEIDYERLEREDISELCGEFPELRIDSLTELDDPLRYGALRDLGLTPTEAYLATRKRHRANTRAHLTPAAPEGAAFGGGSMSRAELEMARELFYGMSDSQISALYKRVNS